MSISYQERIAKMCVEMQFENVALRAGQGQYKRDEAEIDWPSPQVELRRAAIGC